MMLRVETVLRMSVLTTALLSKLLQTQGSVVLSLFVAWQRIYYHCQCIACSPARSNTFF